MAVRRANPYVVLVRPTAPALLSLLILAACDGEPAHPSDRELEAAIKAGQWSASAEARRHDAEPLHTDPVALRAALGAFEYNAEQTTSYRGDDSVEESWVHEITRLEVAADGRYHLKVRKRFRQVDDPPGAGGREAVFDGTHLFTRLNAGRWIRRDLLRRDHERWLHESTRHLEVASRLLGGALVREREGRALRLSAGPWQAPAVADLDAARRSEGDDWYLWWAHVHRPTRAQGTVTLAPAHDVVSEAKLTVEATTTGVRAPRIDTAGPELTDVGPRLFGRRADAARGETAPEPPVTDEKPVTASARFETTLTVTIKAVDDVQIVAPDDARDPRRPRVHRMIRDMLGEGR